MYPFLREKSSITKTKITFPSLFYILAYPLASSYGLFNITNEMRSDDLGKRNAECAGHAFAAAWSRQS